MDWGDMLLLGYLSGIKEGRLYFSERGFSAVMLPPDGQRKWYRAFGG